MIKICDNCLDPTYCQSIIQKCEIEDDEEGIKRLEDERQSEIHYENLKQINNE